KAGRVLAYSDAARPDLFGEPCNLPIGQPHAAVIVDDGTCVAVVEEPGGHGTLVTLRGPIVRHGRWCRSLSPFLNRALSSCHTQPTAVIVDEPSLHYVGSCDAIVAFWEGHAHSEGVRLGRG